MTINFHFAAKRHWDDASLLESNSRVANAGQLYGLSAECGIKAVLIGLGYPIDPDGSPPNKTSSGTPKIREHVNVLANLLADIQTYASGRGGAKYAAMMSSLGNFSDWRVEYRYWDDSALPTSLPAWKISAKEVMRMLQAAWEDGVLK